MKFEWDQVKADENLNKHGVSFEHAVTAFDDINALVKLDIKHSAWEIRERLLGVSDVGILIVIFTIRKPRNIFRIISARPASKRERKLYEEFKRYFI